MDPCLLAVAPNGARRTHDDHAALPMTPAAIARTAKRCLDAGAQLLHLHVRDREGGHSLDPGLYAEAMTAVREAAGDDLIIQITTESAGKYGPREQRDVVTALQPEAVSIALRELVPSAQVDDATTRFFHGLREAGVAAQYIVYSAEELQRFNALRASGVIPAGSAFLLFVLGSYVQRTDGLPEQIDPFLRHLADDDLWAVCAFGPHEARCIGRAAQLGGHARVGFENNLWRPDGSPADDNRDLVDAARSAIEAQGRRLANGTEARAMLGIPSPGR
jgi:uncharacterized protein (DUF849 family)